MKNWGPYHSYILDLYKKYSEKRAKEIDPYKQLVLDEQKKLLVEIEYEYRTYLKGIGNDHGVRFLAYLSNKALSLNKIKKNNKKDYMIPVYNGVDSLLQIVVKRFTKFRIEE